MFVGDVPAARGHPVRHGDLVVPEAECHAEVEFQVERRPRGLCAVEMETWGGSALCAGRKKRKIGHFAIAR